MSDFVKTPDEYPFLQTPEDHREAEEAMLDRQMNPDFALISDFVIGELPEEDVKEVEYRLQTDPDFRDLAEPLLLAYAVPRKTKRMTPEELRRSWLQLRRRVGLPAIPGAEAAEDADELRQFYEKKERERSKRTRNRFLMVAAIFLFLIGAPLGLVELARWQKMTVVSTRPTATLIEALPDGSRATLGGASRLERRNNFAVREVWLRGAATFEVQPFNGGQFTVWTDAAKIVVTGTAFTVEGYPGAPTTVSVSEGTVRVQSVMDDDGALSTPVKLGAGERARMFRGVGPQKQEGTP